MKYNPDQLDLAKGFEKAMGTLNLTTPELIAKRLGEKNRTIYNAEDRGVKNVIKLLEWCDILDCDIDFILGIQDKPRKADTDVHNVTGLGQTAIRTLSNEYEMSIHPKQFGMVDNIDSVLIVNQLFETASGKELLEVIKNYLFRIEIQKYHDLGVKRLVDEINQEHTAPGEIYDSVDSVLSDARKILSRVNHEQALKGLNYAGINQNKMDEEECFISYFKSNRYNSESSLIIYNYLKSEQYAEELKYKCYEKLMAFLEQFASSSIVKVEYKSGWEEIFGKHKLKPPKRKNKR